MEKPSRDDLIYLACFIDCEGCVQIRRAKLGDGWSYTHTARIFLANTYWPVIEALHAIFGGSLELHPPANPNWKMHYRLCFYGRQILELIPEVLPFSRIKHQQLELILDFQRHVAAYSGRGGHRFLNPEEVTWRQEQMDKLKALNRRGPEARLIDEGFRKLR